MKIIKILLAFTLTAEPLLFKGGDFAATDVAAWEKAV